DPQSDCSWPVQNRVKRWREEREEDGGRRRELLDGEKRLANLLGLWWGDAGQPLTVDGPEPPDYMRHNSYQSERWREAWAWRVALDAAAGIVGSRRKVTMAR